MKNSLFVGSFNPITICHQNIATDLLKSKIVDFIYFLPVNSKKTDLISIKNRLAMIDLIKNQNEESLNIYDYEKEGLFNYSILKKIDKNKNITHLIMGSDLFLKFDTFYQYETILKEYTLIIIKRGEDVEKLIQEKYLPYKEKIIRINKEYFGSSTLAKEMLEKNNSTYLNLKVFDYIKKNNLYN